MSNFKFNLRNGLTYRGFGWEDTNESFRYLMLGMLISVTILVWKAALT